MKKSLIRGFTLIELLIVIGIIGILVSVILPNLSTARGKGSGAAFRSEMDSFRKSAETFYTTTYAGLFTTGTPSIDVSTADPSVANILTDLALKAADGKIYGAIDTGGSTYALYGRIPGTTTDSLLSNDIWCIDSTGKSGNPSADATADTQFTVNPSVTTSCW